MNPVNFHSQYRDSKVIGNYFSLSDYANFIIIISSTNKLNYFDYQLPNPYELGMLLSKYKTRELIK